MVLNGVSLYDRNISRQATNIQADTKHMYILTQQDVKMEFLHDLAKGWN